MRPAGRALTRPYTSPIVSRSRADRPYGSLHRPIEHEATAETPVPKPLWSARLARLRDRTRSVQLIGAGALGALAIVALSISMSPAPSQLTRADLDTAIQQALASATPKPNVAIAAYAAIKGSVVLVKTRLAAEPVAQPRGSGVLLDTGGRILTSLHLVRDAVEISVVFFDGEEVPAVIGEVDRVIDIALLEVEASGRKPAVLASSKDLRVGDEAFVVGSPLGLSNSLSVGVISRLGSTFQPTYQTEPLGGLIQFSAAVYPGNSGGPLVNRQGEVVGIVTAVANQSGVSGIGFAVPIAALSSAAGSAPF